MNVTQLRAFVSVVDLGSFSEAARMIGVSQPAVTMQIKALETEVGATLLERRYHGVELTEAGRALLPHALNVLSELTAAREGIASLSDTLTGRLAIAASTTPGDYVIPKLLGSFLKDNPQVQVEITVQDTGDAIAAVEGGRADLGVCGAQQPSAKVDFVELGCDELVVICPIDHPLATRASVAFSQLAEQDWVGREPGSGTGKITRRELTAHDIDVDELRVIVELGTGDAIVSAVEGGLGIAMVSAFVAEKALALGTVARVKLEGAAIQRPFFTVLPKARSSRAAVAFAEHLHQSFRSLTDSGPRQTPQ
jgi:DNA-binding transcriptional LysR family regulator